MATIRLVPSTYSRSNTSYVTVTNESNMYNNTDHTSNYTSIRGRNSSQTSRVYYCYISGFNFNSVPAGATVTGFSVKIRAYRNSYQRTGETYRPRLASTASSGSVISNTILSSDLTTSSGGKVYTFPTGSLTWNNLTSYGSGFTIVIPLNPSSNQYPYVYVYGAEIEVTYTLANSYDIGATSLVSGITVDPTTQSVAEGGSATVTFDVDDITGYVVTDNSVDVTSSLVQHTYSANDTSTQTATQYTTELSASGANFYTSSSTTGHYFNYAVGHTAQSPGSTSTSYNTYVKDNNNNTATGWALYSFDFSDIPAGATIQSVQVQCYGACESTTHDSTHKANITLYSGNTLKSTEQYFTSTSNSTITISNPGTWTRAELQNAKLKFEVAYYGGRLFGITWNVTYSISNPGHYYTYTLTNVTANHVIILDEGGIYIPPEEDPNYTYWPITISSINAETNPSNGTVRVVEGSNQTITISPIDPELTLALDNGVDITSQLTGGVVNTYTVTGQVSGASYGFVLEDGYYTSDNAAVNSSAAVCRVNFDFETEALVTIEYINYAEATYDYGIFGRVDTALGTSYSADSNPYLACSTNAYNTSTPQTVTYTIPSGQHYIDIKYRKDSGTHSYNDNLQWKITNIQSTTGSSDYTYTLTNITEKHSLIFVFGDVEYYLLTSMGTSGCRLFPDGQQVKLPGDNYKLIIVPDDTTSTVTLLDNGNNVTAALEQESGVDKNNNPVVSYTYQLNNVRADHTLTVQIAGKTIALYFKYGSNWRQATKAYKKINGTWVEQLDLTAVFNINKHYRKG